jgi:tellurite resistance protein TerC
MLSDGARQAAERAGPMASDVGRLAKVAYRHARRVVILVVGGTVVLFGIALLFLPGPAFVVIPIGLAILAVEFAWARRWLARAKRMAVDVKNAVDTKSKVK